MEHRMYNCVVLLFLFDLMCFLNAGLIPADNTLTDKSQAALSNETIFKNLAMLLQATAVNCTTESSNNTPLLIFPTDDKKYNIVKNATLVEALQKRYENKSEIEDLLHGGNFEKIHDIPEVIESSTLITAVKDDSIEIPKSAAEWIENGENTEDDKFKTHEAAENEMKQTASYTQQPNKQGSMFAMATAFFIVGAFLAIVGLIAWRRVIQNKYKSREMLINEEEFCDRSDMKNFSL